MELGHGLILGVAIAASLVLAVPAALYFAREYWDRAYPGIAIERGRTRPPMVRGNGAMGYLSAWVVAVFAWTLLIDVVLVAIAKLPPKLPQSSMTALIVVINLVGFLLLVMILVVVSVRHHNERIQRDGARETIGIDMESLT